ncbi:MAG: acetaldehyde dehydrogenase (acetylating) [Candidatus Roizmanbacteria bacterium]|nr:acetaldehyde dehydrogenase (acetylating) [Candidatus Roizmanbacteria bacterium]
MRRSNRIDAKALPRPARVAILGTGKIGIDLLFKIGRSQFLKCVLVAGRNNESSGLEIARQKGVPSSGMGIDAILNHIDEIDIVFDATSAAAHVRHWDALKATTAKVIDMTPSKLGKAIVPAVNLSEAVLERHINMISCGGQSSIPIINAVSAIVENIEYVEVVSSISSKSAGAATRINLDEYIHTTEHGILSFSRAKHAKVILILNPAEPPVHMQTTISFQLENPPIADIVSAVRTRVQSVQQYVPGYDLLIEPKQIESNRVVAMIKVVGQGDYLPKYAGNLDIINCAAVAAAEIMATNTMRQQQTC